MNKKILTIIFAMLVLSGCTSNREADSKTPVTTVVTEPMPKESVAESTSAIPETTISFTDVCNKYSALYDCDHTFSDKFVEGKFWLVGNENIVQLIVVSGYENTTILGRDSIERTTQSTFGDMATVTVFDKTGNKLTLTVSPDEALAIAGLLK